MTDELLTMKEVADLVGVSRQRVHQRVNGISCSKVLEHTFIEKTTRKGTVRKVVRIPRSAAEAWRQYESAKKEPPAAS